MADLKIDNEFKDLISPLTDDEFKQLEENILHDGIQDPLKLWNTTLIDGHNRFEIAQAHNLEFKTVEMQFATRDDAKIWIIKNQFGRRNLSAYDRSILALKLKPVSSVAAKPPIETRKEIAKAAYVSHEIIAKVDKIEAQATPEIKATLKLGDLSINAAYNKVQQAKHKEDIQRQVEEIEQQVFEQPDGLFDFIVIEPPWNYGTQQTNPSYRGNTQYPEMTQDELKAIDLPAAKNCILFLWATHKFIWDAKELLDCWGFDYCCMFVWDKQIIGMGGLIRLQCEFCLIGLKGKPIFKDIHDIRDLISEQKRDHSRKPETFYQLVDKLCIGRKLDYFSRTQRESWSSYGNEIRCF